MKDHGEMEKKTIRLILKRVHDRLKSVVYQGCARGLVALALMKESIEEKEDTEMRLLRKSPVLVLILVMSLSFSCKRSGAAVEKRSAGGSQAAAERKSSAETEGAGEKEAAPAAEPVLYTAHNLWFEKPQLIGSANYKKGAMIPAGTRVRGVHVGEGRRMPTISFTTVRDNATYVIHYQQKFHGALTEDGFRDRLFTPQPFSEQAARFTDREVEAIKKGLLVTGMCRRAVLMAYGYPLENLTPSLKSDVWTYMLDRFRKKEIHFGEGGRTVRPPDEPADSL